MIFYFEKLVQYFVLKRVGDAPKGHPLAPLVPMPADAVQFDEICEGAQHHKFICTAWRDLPTEAEATSSGLQG